ncbi:MAG: hypothetical protein AAGG55_17035 [Pseudomonadota bacterium]
MSQLALHLLLIVKILLIIWGVMGLIEYLEPSADFGLQDANFPPGVQFLHWQLIILTGLFFVGGYVLRWRHTVSVTIAMYATLATLCFVETVDFDAFGGGPGRFLIMSAEYALYVALSVYLLRSRSVKDRFRGA